MSRASPSAGPLRDWLRLLPLVLLLVGSALPIAFGAANASAPAHASGGAPAPSSALPIGRIPLRPLHEPHRAALLARTAAVNPSAYYGSEPAPMGIADFGVDGAGNGYTYQTSAFYGLTVLHKLSVDNSAISSRALTIQLNIVLSFDLGGVNYQYWVQDVAFLDTGTSNLQFENNIWNFSAGNGSMNAQSVSGNGTVYSGAVYIAGADSSLPGADVTISYPTQIGLLASVVVANYEPEVIFQYRDGYGLVTYDNAYFPFAVGATNVNYTVDGTSYNNLNLFDDAELTLGGPGNGASTTASAANLSMSLAYYNGRNFQSIPNAFNFGSDTAEAIAGVHPHLGAFGANGSLWDNLTYGTGALANLYNSSSTSSVEIVTQAGAGQLRINGTAPVPFAAAPVNVTLAPGNYSFALWSLGSLVGQQIATIAPGSFVILYIDAGTVSTVTFTETGLPAGQAWTVTLGSATQSTRGTQLRFLTVNGSFDWHLTPIPGYVANASAGTVGILGSDASIAVNFTEVVYLVTLFETGLPNGTAWSVTTDNRTYNSTGVEVTFHLGNGSFAYALGLVPGWIGSPSDQGTLRVHGRPTTQTVFFRVFTYPAYFNETGLPISANGWAVAIHGELVNTTIPQAIASVPNGSFAFQVLPPPGWIVSPRFGSVRIAAAPASVNLSFTPFRYTLTFEETGLDANVTWGVQVGTVDRPSSAANLTFSLPNGSYAYQIDAVLGYSLLTPLNATVGVDGADVQVPVVFAHLQAVVGTLEGNFVPATAAMYVDGSEVATPGGAFVLTLLAGNHSLEIAAGGYVPYFTNVSLAPGATVDLTTITLHLAAGTGGPPPTRSTTNGTSAGSFPWTLALAGIGLAAVAILAVAWAATRRRPRP